MRFTYYNKPVHWKKFNLRIGEVLMLRPYVLMENNKVCRDPVPGTVVYINHKHHFFTAEFKSPSGSFRESFKFYTKDDMACYLVGAADG